jgi:N-methylhydantoinase A
MELSNQDITNADIEKLAREFHKRHENLYTFSMSWVPVEFRTLRLIARIPVDKIEMKKISERTGDAAEALKPGRECFFDNGYVETSIYDSAKLKAGNVIMGPSVIETPVTTLVVPREFSCTVDVYGNYIMKEA